MTGQVETIEKIRIQYACSKREATDYFQAIMEFRKVSAQSSLDTKPKMLPTPLPTMEMADVLSAPVPMRYVHNASMID